MTHFLKITDDESSPPKILSKEEIKIKIERNEKRIRDEAKAEVKKKEKQEKQDKLEAAQRRAKEKLLQVEAEKRRKDEEMRLAEDKRIFTILSQRKNAEEDRQRNKAIEALKKKKVDYIGNLTKCERRKLFLFDEEKQNRLVAAAENIADFKKML
jgi:colicin import membrane protein